MYSCIKSVTILVSLLKKYNVSHVVLSPGGSDIPIIHSVQHDSYFKCFSVVDERSAAYFAMGMAQQLNRPVACICTSGTAVCNYLPGITEAFYQNVPVVAITADKDPYYQGQLEIQKINQVNIFGDVVKKAVNLPVVQNEKDEWLCNRLINEALLELNHHGSGPVQINIPIVGAQTLFNCHELPDERKINIVSLGDSEEKWLFMRNKLAKYKKILVVVGQNINFTEKEVVVFEKFFEKYDCVYAVETLSNLQCKGCVKSYPISEILSTDGLVQLQPDLIISIGNNLSAYLLKTSLRNVYKEIDNWLISESGEVRDTFMCLKEIFECSPKYFFEFMNAAGKKTKSEQRYFAEWNNLLSEIQIPDFGFSNYYIAKKLSQKIPAGSILHTAILNSTRVMQYFDLADKVKSYSNVGALGIDGCFSSFAGQAAVSEDYAYLLIGDLSFFYDMNAASLRSISSNVRIILINNSGGAEFHVWHDVEDMDSYICAEHKHSAGGYIESLGYKYFSAHNKMEFDKAAEILDKPSSQPIFIECFTDMYLDADATNEFYGANKKRIIPSSPNAISKAKGLVKSVLSEEQVDKTKKFIKLFKK